MPRGDALSARPFFGDRERLVLDLAAGDALATRFGDRLSRFGDFVRDFECVFERERLSTGDREVSRSAGERLSRFECRECLPLDGLLE